MRLLLCLTRGPRVQEALHAANALPQLVVLKLQDRAMHHPYTGEPDRKKCRCEAQRVPERQPHAQRKAGHHEPAPAASRNSMYPTPRSVTALCGQGMRQPVAQRRHQRVQRSMRRAR
jgi:hypothetical protein